MKNKMEEHIFDLYIDIVSFSIDTFYDKCDCYSCWFVRRYRWTKG